LNLLKLDLTATPRLVDITVTGDVKEVFTKSGLDPRRLNVFALILDQDGQVAHSFYGLPATAYKIELAKGLAKLNLPEPKPPEPGR
jgi:hypothetical protein